MNASAQQPNIISISQNLMCTPVILVGPDLLLTLFGRLGVGPRITIWTALPYSVTSTVEATFPSLAGMSCLSVSCVRHVYIRNMELERSPVAIPGV